MKKLILGGALARSLRRPGVRGVVATVGALGLMAGSFGVFAGTASAASGGVSIVTDTGVVGTCDLVFSGSPCFGPPNTGLHPGDSTTLLVTVQQDDPQSNGTIAITWPAGELAFVSNGDSSATCTPTTSSVTCTYTDFAHGFKSDSFNFTVGPNAPLSTVPASINASTSDGSDTAAATIQMAGPSSTDQCKKGAWATMGVFKNQGDCVSFVATGGKNPPAKG